MQRQLRILLRPLYWLHHYKHNNTINQKIIMGSREIPLSLNICKLNHHLNWCKLPSSLFLYFIFDLTGYDRVNKVDYVSIFIYFE
jgi:hypothetical protein